MVVGSAGSALGALLAILIERGRGSGRSERAARSAEEKVADNAKRVHELGRELYKRLSVMSEHIAGIGDSLSKSVKKYNAFVGSLEGSVMPQARRFNELEVEGISAEIDALPGIEFEPRPLLPDRDLVIPLRPAPVPAIGAAASA